MIELRYVLPIDYTNLNGTFTVDGTTFKTPNVPIFQSEINDDAYYYFSCNYTLEKRESNFFMAKYTKPFPDLAQLSMNILKRNDYINNKPDTDTLKQGLYQIKIDIYWGLFEHNISTLEDVQITNIQDADVLKYDSLSSKWLNAPDVSGPATLGALTDVTLTAPTVNEVLTYDGAGQWINQAVIGSVTALPDLTDVTLTAPTVNEVLTYDGAGQWINQAVVNPSVALPDLTDITLSALTLNEVLTYSGGGQWTNQAPIAPSVALPDLTDVTLSAPNVNEVLTYNGAGQWVNQVQLGATELNGLSDVNLIGVISSSETMLYDSNTLQFTNVPPAIKKAVWSASPLFTINPLAGEFSIVDGGGGSPNTFYINQIDKTGRDFSIQLSNWLTANVRDLSFSSTSVSPFVLNIISPLTLGGGGVWSAETNEASIAITPNALYTVELDARHLLYIDNNNNVSLNSADDFGIGTGNMNLTGEFSSGITSGANNTVVGTNAGVTGPTAIGNTLLGMGTHSGFDNCICIGPNATASEQNSLNITNMTIDLTAAAGAGGAPPVSVEGYLRVYINGTQYRLPLYV